MALYWDRLHPWIQDHALDRGPMREVRARTCAGLEGAVLEIGFGTGLNLAFFPPAVRSLAAVEPSRRCLELAARRIEASAAEVTVVGADAGALDLPAEGFDAALSTWTLCTVPDLDAALREVHRVLRPGATYHFAEHGLAPDERVARWQRRIGPVHRRLSGGCRLTREIPAAIERAGFSLEMLRCAYLPGDPKVFSYLFEGVARRR